MYILSATVCSAILITAAYQDWKTREIDDRCWIAFCTIGPLLLFTEDPDILRLIGSIVLAAVMLSERMSGWRAVLPAAAGSACLFLTDDLSSAMIPVVFFSIYGMYCAGILKGGADAKALMSIAISFPFYPESVLIQPCFPAGYVFCPCFSVLTTALVITLAWALPRSVHNWMHGYGLSVSETMDLDDAESSFVWPVEDVKDGVKVGIRPNDDPEIIKRLREAGYDKVRVTRKIPFVIPVSVSFIAMMTIGSPLFLLV